MSTEFLPSDSIHLTQISQIVSSYLKRTPLSSLQVENLRTALCRVFVHYDPNAMTIKRLMPFNIKESTMPETSETPPDLFETKTKPAVAIEDSIRPDCLICLEDGAQVKSLGPHLKARHGLTPAQYREKWSLGSTYPMTVANQIKKRTTTVASDEPKSPVNADLPSSTIFAPISGEKEVANGPTELDNIVLESGAQTDGRSGSAESKLGGITANDDAKDRGATEEYPLTSHRLNKSIPDTLISATTAVISDTISNDSPSANDVLSGEGKADAGQTAPPKARTILRLAAWQKPAAPNPQPQSLAPQMEAGSQETPEAISEEKPLANSKPVENQVRGFRYPVNRYSR